MHRHGSIWREYPPHTSIHMYGQCLRKPREVNFLNYFGHTCSVSYAAELCWITLRSDTTPVQITGSWAASLCPFPGPDPYLDPLGLTSWYGSGGLVNTFLLPEAWPRTVLFPEARVLPGLFRAGASEEVCLRSLLSHKLHGMGRQGPKRKCHWEVQRKWREDAFLHSHSVPIRPLSHAPLNPAMPLPHVPSPLRPPQILHHPCSVSLSSSCCFPHPQVCLAQWFRQITQGDLVLKVWELSNTF